MGFSKYIQRTYLNDLQTKKGYIMLGILVVIFTFLALWFLLDKIGL